jgi:hypothetical protein
MQKRNILVDGGSLIPGILTEDPINEYYRGMPGDIYRIEDAGKVRYRRVVRGELARKDVKRTDVIPQSDSKTYGNAFETLLQMCRDRGLVGKIPDWSDEEIQRRSTEGELMIDGLRDRRGRQVCIAFIPPYELLDITATVIVYVDRCITSLQRSNPDIAKLSEFNIKEPRSHQQYGMYADILLIYNAPDYKVPPNRAKFSSNFLQFMSIQQLQHNITLHQDMPGFTLLDLAKDGKEILDIYMLNGQLLEDNKTLAEYNLVPQEPGIPVQLILI